MRSPWLQCAFLVAIIPLVHLGAFEIPFLYSEVAGIQTNAVVRDLGVFWERMVTPRGLFERPLSVLTYALNHAVHGDRVFGYHAVNLVIHALNTLLVYALARRFFRAPFVAGLVFALHPLATAVVSQVFGRNYSLASTFCFAGLYLYMAWRQQGPLGWARSGVLGVLFALTVLTKQSLVLFPLLLVWYELALAPSPGRQAARRRGTLVAGVTACGLVGVALVLGYAIPLSATAPVTPWTYVFSQLGNLDSLLSFYFLPYQTALVHDLYFHDSWSDPEVVIAAALLATVLLAVWRWRTNPVAWLVGAMALCLLPTNTVLPKNEVIREWRLYPSLFFFALWIGCVHDAARAWLVARFPGPWPGRFLGAALGLWMLAFAHSDFLQNRAYSSRMTAWQQVLDHYPHSTDAMNNLGLVYRRHGRLEDALAQFHAATAAAPEIALYWSNRAVVEREMGDGEAAEASLLRGGEAVAKHGALSMAVRFKQPQGPEPR